MGTPSDREVVRQYHDETKHHFDRFARSLGYLDWATQPNPFRSFAGAPRVDLVAPFLSLAWDRHDRPAPFPVPPGLGAVSAFFRYSLGLSAWKHAGSSRWALRINPSSGNLHPTEGYAVAGPGTIEDTAAVYHYAPDAHALERRCAFAAEGWAALAGPLPPGTFLAGLTSIHWREAWKYGERAFRYCQHDIGHAIAAMQFAAAAMGWECRVLPAWPGATLATLMGLDRDADFGDAEREEPACLCVVSPGRPDAFTLGESPALIDAVSAGDWVGLANRLSADRVPWDLIDRAASASRMPPGSAGTRPAADWRSPDAQPDAATAPPGAQVLLQRRSATEMDGHSAIPLDRFLSMLRRMLPGPWAPWDALWWRPRIHLVLFVHRVVGLEPGIYALVRAPGTLDMMHAGFRADFAWVQPPGVPADVPLYLLAPLDVRRLARQLSCGQDIAADGFFSLAMIAEFDDALDAHGPWFYRHLFWEAGAIGQALYLEAESAGARGTGIGCFFDDGVHEALGIRGHRLQSLYHFTIGMPVHDTRLQTRPGYDWE